MTVITWYGGSDTSYVESNGIPLARVTGAVYASVLGGSAITALKAMAADGTVSDVAAVLTDALGFYKFGISGALPGGVVYLDFGVAGSYRKAVAPLDTPDRLVAAEAAIATLTAGGGSGIGTFGDRGTWSIGVAMVAGNIYTVPGTNVTGFAYTRWLVTTAYTTASSGLWGTADQVNAIPLGVSPTGFGYLTASVANGLYLPASSNYGMCVFWDGGLLRVGFDLDPNGVDMPFNGQVNQLVAELDLPPAGADIIAHVYRLNTGTTSGNTETDIGTITVTDGQVLGLTTLGDPLTFLKKDKIGVRFTQVGSVFPGAGVKIRLMLGTETAASVVAPGVVTALSNTTSDATSTTITWTAPAGASQFIVYRGNPDGTSMVPYRQLGTVTSFTDRGPDELGLASGSLYGYAVKARRYTAVSALTSVITAGTSAAAFSWLPNATGAGALDSAMATVVVGSGVTGTPVSVGGSGAGPLLLTGGNSLSSNNIVDRVTAQHIKDPTLHSGWFVNAAMHPTNSGTLWAINFESNDPNLTGTSQKGFQLQFQLGAIRLGAKLGSPTPTGLTPAGLGSAGSFQNLTDPTFPSNFISGATRTSANGIALPANFSTTVDAGFRLEALPPVSGAQTINVKYGTLAQYGTAGATASSLPTLFSALIPASWMASVVPGSVYLQVLGQTTAAGTPYQVSLSDFKVGALTPAGT